MTENDAKTTGLVELHTNIGNREGAILELRPEHHADDPPAERDMSHLLDEKIEELYRQLGAHLGKQTFDLQFVCDSCGEALEAERDGDFFHHGEYHRCFGEQVNDVALLLEDGLTTTRDGIRIETDE